MSAPHDGSSYSQRSSECCSALGRPDPSPKCAHLATYESACGIRCPPRREGRGPSGRGRRRVSFSRPSRLVRRTPSALRAERRGARARERSFPIGSRRALRPSRAARRRRCAEASGERRGREREACSSGRILRRRARRERGTIARSGAWACRPTRTSRSRGGAGGARRGWRRHIRGARTPCLRTRNRGRAGRCSVVPLCGRYPAHCSLPWRSYRIVSNRLYSRHRYPGRGQPGLGATR